MRIALSLAAIVLLAGCGDPSGAAEQALAAADPAASDDGRLDCAVDGATAFERVCRLERVQGAQGMTLTLRHPGGGFRRLLVTTDGRGVVAADGSQPARVAIMDENRIEVAITTDRYRLPATVKGPAAR